MSIEERKREIFAVAEKLFGERGYDTVTMSQIAAQAGMSKKTLYVHFTDKEELLKSLVSSSYIWPENAFGLESADQIAELRLRLKVIADHVLSRRHIRLCRLAIAEGAIIKGLAETFYEMGIAKSRATLIETIDRIDLKALCVPFTPATLADMLFGATSGKLLFDALMRESAPDMAKVYIAIDDVVDKLFPTDH